MGWVLKYWWIAIPGGIAVPVLAWVLRRQLFRLAKRDLLTLLALAEDPLGRGQKRRELVLAARRRFRSWRAASFEDRFADAAVDLFLDDYVRSRTFTEQEQLDAARAGAPKSEWSFYVLTERGAAEAERLKEER